jgi:hypothetical protein
MDSLNEPSLLIRALRQVLYPLVKLALAKGVSFPQLQELLKAVYVEVAEKEFRLPGKEQTDSRISLLSGLHRKDVKRLRFQPATEESVTSRSIPLGAQVVSRWSGDPDYLDTEGLPRPLPQHGNSPDEPSFRRLVASISTDIRARALLDEWLQQGVVERNDDDLISLNLDALVPQAGIEEKLFYFGNNLRDHAAAATHNICGDGPPLMERCVHYSGISSVKISTLQSMAEAKGMKLLLDINRAAATPQDVSPASPGSPQERFTFGIYFYRAPLDPESETND